LDLLELDLDDLELDLLEVLGSLLDTKSFEMLIFDADVIEISI
jgi:hypothetical protein